NAVLEAMRVAHRDDLLAVLDRGRGGQGQGGQSLGVDADDGKIEVAIEGVDGGGLMALAVGQLDSDGATLADDVQVGGDESLADDEAGAETALLSVAARHRDDDDRLAH